MSRISRYSPELRERAVRMVKENRADYRSEWAAFDVGSRPGITSDEQARLKQLEREVKDLRRANAILKDASIFFATDFDGQIKR
jgi:transposase